MSLIVGEINAHHSRWDTNTNKDEGGKQLTDEIDAADNTILSEDEAAMAIDKWPVNFTRHKFGLQ